MHLAPVYIGSIYIRNFVENNNVYIIFLLLVDGFLEGVKQLFWVYTHLIVQPSSQRQKK